MNKQPDERAALPLLTVREAVDLVSRTREEGRAGGKALVEASAMADLLEAVGGFTVSPRALKNYSSSRLGLVDPPVEKDGKTCYLFPDHFDRLGLVLTLRRAYHLPFATIRQLLERLPAATHHLILERKLGADDLLDLAKMLPKGFGVGDLVMAKTCDFMVQDTLSSSGALTAATEPGDELRRLEEGRILARLDEIRAWVSSGRRQEYVRREAAEDFKHLAEKRLIGRKIARKVLARRARLAGQKHQP